LLTGRLASSSRRVIDVSIEDIRNLVAKEKENETQLKEAQEEASRIIEQAERQAKVILKDVEDPSYFPSLHEQEIRRVEERKKVWETECDKALEKVKNKAARNRQKTVDHIIKLVFGGQKTNGRSQIEAEVSERK